MKKTNDGGPAFPLVTSSGIYSNGMSTRVWLAGQSPNVWANASVRDVAEIMGVPVPTHQESPKAWFAFWLSWEVYRRYAFADAMIAAQEKKNGKV